MLSPSHPAAAETDQIAWSAALSELAASMSGDLVTPGNEGWDTARQAWALAVDQRPAAVALPESAQDVAEVVRFARRHGLRVAPQGTGHNAHPLEGRLEGAILIKTERMRGVQVDPASQTARVQAGAVWHDVTLPAAEHGLAALAGSSPDVGVVGYTLGGGLSWLARKHGLAADSVRAVELVSAEGELIRADHEHHPDLFWALRGGGGSFGVVTCVELRLLPIDQVYAGAMFWPQERAEEVLHAWRKWTQTDLPDEVMSVGRVLNVPPLPDVPEPLRGRSFVVVEAVFIGDEAEGAGLIAPLRELGPEIDTFATVPMPALAHLHMDPEQPVPGKGDGLLLEEMSKETIDAFLEAAAGEAGAALISAEIRQLGGAVGRRSAGAGALGAIAAPYAVFSVGAAPTPELQAVIKDKVAAVKRALEPWSAGYEYANFAETADDARGLHAHEYTFRRLQQVKATYDPADTIQANHPVRPRPE